MMTTTAMLVADAIVQWFVTDEWKGAEFSEVYVGTIVLEAGEGSEAFDDAVNYLCEVKLLAPTMVERNGRYVPGLRVL